MGEDNPRVRNVARELDSEASSSIREQADRTPDRAHGANGSLSDLEQDSPPSTAPRFIQDQGAWRKWRWVPYPVRRSVTAAARWTEGPTEHVPYRIKPLFPKVQHAPIALLDRFLPLPKYKWWRIGLAFLWLGLWLMSFALVKRHGLVSSEVQGWGKPGDIGCGNTYWVPGNSCGLDGNDCRPFNGSGFAFRCPASCTSYQVLNPRAVGTTEVIYQTLVVGGPSQNSSRAIYRGDSFICSAAIHAGVITNLNGGCGVVRLVGKQKNFEGSERNGISSVGFNSHFPLAFTFEAGIECSAVDVRWYLLAISIVFSTFFSLFVKSPAMFFFSIFTILFWHVGIASDPPNHSTIPGLISTLIGRYLPAMLAAWVMFDKMGPRRTLTGLTAQIEKTILWLGGAWVGALENISLAWIPIQRLTPHDLNQQPGAKVALAFIVIILVGIAASQIYFFRQEGRLLSKLQLYIVFGVGIGILAALPNLSLRIHHYILALLLLPGTSMQTRPSLLYQGILIGLFINGIARWNWDPILQTAAALQGDAQHGSLLTRAPRANNHPGRCCCCRPSREQYQHQHYRAGQHHHLSMETCTGYPL